MSYEFLILYVSVFLGMLFAFYLVMVTITRRNSVQSDMLQSIEAMKVQLAAIQPATPFMKHAENTLADILHHDGDTSGMDELLDQLKRAPEEPMSTADRDKLKGLLSQRQMDVTRSEKERKVAGIMGDMMDLVLDEAASADELTNIKAVGVKVGSKDEEENKDKI